MEVRTKYTFDGSFVLDVAATKAARREPDFSGAGCGFRDLGWVVGSELEAERIKRDLRKIGLKSEIKEMKRDGTSTR
jgi:hypothetical protein